jgi:DNA-binding LacI/PurR family transcriptional regulator
MLTDVTAHRPRVTLDDVAGAAGVSRMTASYTFNRPERVAAETRRRVLAAADELGYRGPDPNARALRRPALRSLGLLLGESLDYVFEDPQATRFVAGLARECSKLAYGLTILPTSSAESDAAAVRAAAVDAFVVWTTTADDPALAAALATRRPVVVHGGPRLEAAALVGIDDRAAARELAHEVWRRASAPAVLSFPLDRKRHSALVHGLDPDTAAYPVTRARLQGFQDAARERGFAWDEIPVLVCSRNDRADAARGMAALMASARRPDAISAMSDQLAFGARDAQDSLILGGFDDSEEAARGGLTTIRQSLFEQGSRAARLALHAGEQAESERDSWTLIKRASTLGGGLT